MNAESALPLNHTQDEISPIKDGDFVGEDGMIRCGVCGKRKQFKIKIGSLERLFLASVIAALQSWKRKENG